MPPRLLWCSQLTPLSAPRHHGGQRPLSQARRRFLASLGTIAQRTLSGKAKQNHRELRANSFAGELSAGPPGDIPPTDTTFRRELGHARYGISQIWRVRFAGGFGLLQLRLR